MIQIVLSALQRGLDLRRHRCRQFIRILIYLYTYLSVCVCVCRNTAVYYIYNTYLNEFIQIHTHTRTYTLFYRITRFNPTPITTRITKI